MLRVRVSGAPAASGLIRGCALCGDHPPADPVHSSPFRWFTAALHCQAHVKPPRRVSESGWSARLRRRRWSVRASPYSDATAWCKGPHPRVAARSSARRALRIAPFPWSEPSAGPSCEVGARTRVRRARELRYPRSSERCRRSQTGPDGKRRKTFVLRPSTWRGPTQLHPRSDRRPRQRRAQQTRRCLPDPGGYGRKLHRRARRCCPCRSTEASRGRRSCRRSPRAARPCVPRPLPRWGC